MKDMIVENKLKMCFKNIAKNGYEYNCNLKKIDYFQAMMLAIDKNQMFKYNSNNVYLFKHHYNKSDSILMIFAIPIESDDPKSLSERIFDVLKDIEYIFITLDYRNLKEDKQFTFLTVVKKIEKGDSLEDENSEFGC
jgi:hypothetical protein